MGAGVLPVALFRGTIYILLGQERYNDSWSDFGGSREKNETPFYTAIREGTEELNGFFGSEEDLEEELNYKSVLTLKYDCYTSYVFSTKYNRELPKYFNNNNKFIEKQDSDKIRIIRDKKNGLYEKSRIEWFDLKEFENEDKLQMIRPHYREIIKSLTRQKNLKKNIKLSELTL